MVEAPGIGSVKKSHAAVPSSLTTMLAGSLAPVVSVGEEVVAGQRAARMGREKCDLRPLRRSDVARTRLPGELGDASAGSRPPGRRRWSWSLAWPAASRAVTVSTWSPGARRRQVERLIERPAGRVEDDRKRRSAVERIGQRRDGRAGAGRDTAQPRTGLQHGAGGRRSQRDRWRLRVEGKRISRRCGDISRDYGHYQDNDAA